MTEISILYDTMRKRAYIKITEEEWKELDQIIEAAGFKTRTEYFSAAAFATIYGESTSEWCKNIRNLANFKRETEKTFLQLLDEYALPIIAMRGCKAACRNLSGELQELMFEKCGIVYSGDTIRRHIQIYEQINKAKLEDYRTVMYAEQYQETKYAE